MHIPMASGSIIDKQLPTSSFPHPTGYWYMTASPDDICVAKRSPIRASILDIPRARGSAAIHCVLVGGDGGWWLHEIHAFKKLDAFALTPRGCCGWVFG